MLDPSATRVFHSFPGIESRLYGRGEPIMQALKRRIEGDKDKNLRKVGVRATGNSASAAKQSSEAQKISPGSQDQGEFSKCRRVHRLKGLFLPRMRKP
jgi:hypothetical protein